jgi:hypothetical protein
MTVHRAGSPLVGEPAPLKMRNKHHFGQSSTASAHKKGERLEDARL